MVNTKKMMKEKHGRKFSDKHYKSKLVLTIILILILIATFFYFVPRFIVVVNELKKYGNPKKYENIGIEGLYQGEYIDLDYSGISMKLPIFNMEYQSFKYANNNDNAFISGYDYDIIISRKVGEPIAKGDIIQEGDRSYMSGFKTVQEYCINSFEVSNEDFSIFQPIDSLVENYRAFDAKAGQLKIWGSQYCLYTPDFKSKYVYLAMLKNITGDMYGRDILTIFVYDITNNYDRSIQRFRF